MEEPSAPGRCRRSPRLEARNRQAVSEQTGCVLPCRGRDTPTSEGEAGCSDTSRAMLRQQQAEAALADLIASSPLSEHTWGFTCSRTEGEGLNPLNPLPAGLSLVGDLCDKA